MGNAASAQISMAYGLRGPLFAVSSACASSNDAARDRYDRSSRDAIAIVGGQRGDGHSDRDGLVSVR